LKGSFKPTEVSNQPFVVSIVINLYAHTGMKKSALLLLFAVISAFTGRAQEMLGMVNSNYSGINSLMVNPSAMLNSRHWLDINLVGLGVFADNNYAYMPKEDFWIFDLLKRNYELPKYGKYERPVKVDDIGTLKNAYFNQRINFPSAMLVNFTEAYALSFSYRTAVSGSRIPYDVANFAFYGLEHEAQQNIEYNDHNFKMAGVSWAEIGLSYATILKHKRFDFWTGGITLKYLLGTGGGYANVDNVRYVVLNDSTIDIRNLDAEVGFAGPVDYDRNTFPGPNGIFNGRGLAFDIGITFIKTPRELKNIYHDKLCSQRYEDYKYRLGISLLDVGSIHFSSNAQKHTYDGVSHFWEDLNLGYDNLTQALQDVSQRFYGSPTASLRDTSVSIGLPTALSVQYDYHYSKNFYLNGTAVIGLPLFGDASVERPSQIAFTPRYETKNFEANFPVSLYNLKSPRLGLALRFYSFTIGTEKLGSLLGMTDFYGTDIYLSVRLVFRKGECREPKSSTPCGRLSFD
jgi:hypothetical protein